MNNLKRILSLGLVGTMLSGMMVMGASAADFTDADKIAHDDAVNTLVALKIIDGKPDGSFDPEGNVSRAEMAKMIATAMNGGTDANTGVKGTPSFTDIGGHWAESYIEYCSDLGIISGRGDGTFAPDAQVTGLEATKMVLTALGYDATAYKLTGNSWAVRTDELARTADPKLYDELETVMMAANATRDTAAQLIWNGLQNQTRKVTPSTNTNTGEVTWQYNSGDMMLTERYGAQIWKGTYEGNDKSISSLDDGQIRVNGKLSTATAEAGTRNADFASDLGIENIGEEVKVIFRDATGGTANVPDKRDTVYGVFNTGKTEVYNITKNDLQSCTDANKIKFGDSKYDTLASVKVVTNYDNSNETTVTSATINSNAASGWRQQSVDQIKFVCDEDGKISAAYVVEVKAGRVTSITASKITVSGVGAVDIADNDVAEGLKKDDVVVYTKLYDTDKDDAFFSFAKAEEVEGELTGYKNSDNVVVDGKTYKINNKANPMDSLTDDPITAASDDTIGDTVKLFLADGMVVAMQSIESSGGNYAIVTDVTDGSKGIDSAMDPLRITVKTSDGNESTLLVHKDSTKDGSAKIKDEADAEAQEALFAACRDKDGKAIGGVLIEYSSIANGTIKIKEIFAPESTAPTGAYLWNKDTKALNTTGTTTHVAATDAVLFVGVDNSNGTQDGFIDDYYVYSLRNLGNIAIGRLLSGAKVTADVNSDGLVKAAYVSLNARPGSTTSDTLYGIITGYAGRRNNADGDTLYRYTVAVNRDEEIEINVDSQTGLASGVVITFDEAADGEYATATDIHIIDSNNSDWTYGAVKEYNESSNLLSYFTATSRGSANEGFTGTGTAASVTVDKDVKIVYVNTEDEEDGSEIGVGPFDSSTGFANVVFHKDSDGVVDVIIVETSDKAFKGCGAGFGTTTTYAVTTPTAVTAGTNNGAYSATVTPASPFEAGATVTVTVKCTTAPTKGTDTVSITSASDAGTISGGTKTNTSTGEVGTWTFSMPAKAVADLTITVTNDQD